MRIVLGLLSKIGVLNVQVIIAHIVSRNSIAQRHAYHFLLSPNHRMNNHAPFFDNNLNNKFCSPLITLQIILKEQSNMYPPKRDTSNGRPKLTSPHTKGLSYSNSPNFRTNSNRDINKINKILENAKNYHRQKDREPPRKDFLMQGLSQARKASNSNLQPKPEVQKNISSNKPHQNIQQDHVITKKPPILQEQNVPRQNFQFTQSRYDHPTNTQNGPIPNYQLSSFKTTPKQPSNHEFKSIARKTEETVQNKPTQQVFNKKAEINPLHDFGENIISMNSISSFQHGMENEEKRKSQYRKTESKLDNRSSIDPQRMINRQNQNTLVQMKCLLEQTQRELTEIRGQFYKSEEKKNFFQQKVRQFDRQNKELQKKNQDSLLKAKNLQNILHQKQTQIDMMNKRLETKDSKENRAVEELERRMHEINEQLVDKINENRYLTNKLTGLQGKFKMKEAESARYTDIFQNNSDTIQKVKKEYEQQIFELQNQTNILRKEIRQAKMNRNSSEKAVQEITNKLTKENLLKIEQSEQKYEIEIMHLKTEIKQYQGLMGRFQENQKISSTQAYDKQINLQQQIKQIQHEKIELVNKYESLIAVRDQVIEELREQIRMAKSEKQYVFSEPEEFEFEDALKKQVREMNELRDKISKKNYENLNLLAEIEKIKAEKQNLERQIGWLKAQQDIIKRNTAQQANSQLNKIQNQAKNSKIKLDTVYKQLQIKNKEVTEKDKFILNYLTSITNQKQAQKIIKDLSKIFANK